MTPRPGLCEACGRPAHERYETLTGRLVCQTCNDDLLASSVALVQGGGAGEAIAASGWRRRLRWFRGKGRPGRPGGGL